jgi:sarcosine oxidase delta subunit
MTTAVHLTENLAEEDMLSIRKQFLTHESIRCPYCTTRRNREYNLRKFSHHLRAHHQEAARRWHTIQRRIIALTHVRHHTRVCDILLMSQPREV